ncbi:uncharacterized protein JCM6883_004080 [Sporobolomyces salmoneus]|uniref:uncharacterized protein n=1 Tax=Sporobolomyces salmoneus TaxID=183962 RepID=UPI00316F44C0
MSHLPDAPILKTRHQHLRNKRTHPLVPLSDTESFPLEDPSSSLSSSPRYQPYRPHPVHLRPLRLPQIAKRHANFQSSSEVAGPRFFNLLPKRAPVDLGGEVVDIDEDTDCREFVEGYEGSQTAGQVRRKCGIAVSEARKAANRVTTSRRTSTATRTATSTPSTSGIRTRTPVRRVAAQTVPARIAAVSLTAEPSNSAALESNVNQIFSEAASIIASRSSSRAALATSVDSVFSQAASAISSRRAASTRTSSGIPSSTVAPSTSSLLSSSSSSIPASSTSLGTSSAPTPSSSSSSTSSSHRIRNIVVPSVVIPIGLLLLFLLGFCCWKKRKRRTAGGGGGLGPISAPRPLRLAAGGNYGTGGTRGEMTGIGAGGIVAAGARGGGGRNGSNETLGTTPSAIGVAVSEPRSKWGRKSLIETLAGGVLGSAASGNGSSPTPSRGGGALHSRQESVTSSLDRGTGGYNSKGGYRPGMPRPFSPVQAQDPFNDMVPTIVPVPSATRRPSSLSSGSDPSLYNRGSSNESNENATARLARPITTGYPLYEESTTPGVESRTSTEGEQGFWTAAESGVNSSREAGIEDAYGFEGEEEELRGEAMPVSQAAPVNFGSSSSDSSGGSTPVIGGSGSGTPRLGSGHGSRGYRRGDSNWWG